MTRATTESADYLFAVKENGDGIPRIVLEPRGSTLAALGDGFLSLELRDGVTMRRAEEIAQLLNDTIIRVSHTRFLR